MKLPTPTINMELRMLIYRAIKDKPYKMSIKNLLLELPLFREEAVLFLDYMKSNPELTEKQALYKMEEITTEMTTKLGLTAYDRDKYYPMLPIDNYKICSEREQQGDLQNV